MIAEELLRVARSQGAAFQVLVSGRIKVLADSPLPDTLMAELRQHKQDITLLLAQEPDYQATACLCSVPIGPAGRARCGVSGTIGSSQEVRPGLAHVQGGRRRERDGH